MSWDEWIGMVERVVGDKVETGAELDYYTNAYRAGVSPAMAMMSYYDEEA